MTNQFYPECGLIVTIVGGLIGASWIISKNKDDIQNKYRDQILEMESTIYASDIIPEVMNLVSETNKDMTTNEDTNIEEVLAAEKYSAYISNIFKAENKITTVKYEYKNLQKALSKLSRNLLIEAILSGLFLISHLFNMFSLLPWPQNSVITLALIPILFILVEIINNFLYYRARKEYLSLKYDEIIIGVNTID